MVWAAPLGLIVPPALSIESQEDPSVFAVHVMGSPPPLPMLSGKLVGEPWKTVPKLRLGGLTTRVAGLGVQLHATGTVLTVPVKVNVALAGHVVSGMRMFTGIDAPANNVPLAG